MICGAVLLNFMAAYDVIDQELEKFECYECRQSAAAWMESYLLNRLQSFFFNGSYSDSVSLVCEVPQGNFLGPLYFTNNLPQTLN